MQRNPSLFGTLFVIALLLIGFFLKISPGIFAGILALSLAHALRKRLEPKMKSHIAKLVGTTIIVSLVAIALTGIGVGVHGFFKHDGGYHKMLTAIVEQASSVKEQIPASIADNLPDGVDELSSSVSDWLKEHSSDTFHAGKEGASTFVHILLGIIIALLAFHSDPFNEKGSDGITKEVKKSFDGMVTSFSDVFGAQAMISGINTVFTSAYLFILLPLFGIDFGMHKWTLLVITFTAGLIPVVGNLISNCAIVGVSIIYSMKASIASLVFLIVIHKLEYFMNAKIIGNRINAKPWELLLWMVFMESAFGVPGVLFAPVLCAWTKREFSKILHDREAPKEAA